MPGRLRKSAWSQDKISARDAKLKEMIEAARVRPERSWRARSKPLMRIDLRESSVLKSAPPLSRRTAGATASVEQSGQHLLG